MIFPESREWGKAVALSWVKVVGAAKGRSVFVNGNFIDPAGKVGNPFRVETGLNTFALLNPDKTVERSLDATVDLHQNKSDPQLVDLSLASPPVTASNEPAP
jgi:hypothetical protein